MALFFDWYSTSFKEAYLKAEAMRQETVSKAWDELRATPGAYKPDGYPQFGPIFCDAWYKYEDIRKQSFKDRNDKLTYQDDGHDDDLRRT